MKQIPEQHQATLDAARDWAKDLQVVTELIGPRFSRSEARRRAAAYLRGLISPVERKNGWQLAEVVGDKKPYGVQHLLGRAEWNADEVRDDLRTYVVEHLNDPAAVLVVDETGFLKKGTKSVGVARQYSGTAGRVENCQIGVFLAYAARKGRTFLDRELYLPKSWAADAARREEAGVPTEVKFATKPQMARQMIWRVIEASVPFGWVAGDCVYGSDSRMRSWLEEREISYVLGITAQYRIFTGERREWASAVIAGLPKRAWQRVSCGAGSKGERVYDWARVLLRKVGNNRRRWLLARRSISAPQEITYYAASGPTETPLAELARVAGSRWAIEESFETAKGEVGLDQYEVRSWAGWYRHITLAMLAHAYLTVLRASAVEAEQGAQKKRRGGVRAAGLRS